MAQYTGEFVPLFKFYNTHLADSGVPFSRVYRYRNLLKSKEVLGNTVYLDCQENVDIAKAAKGIPGRKKKTE